VKITLIHYAVPPIVGGVESVIGHHARLMAKGGHTVSVVAGRGDSFDRRIQFVKIPILDSRHSSVMKLKTVLDIGEIPEEFASIVAKIENRLATALKGSDVVIAHNVCSLNKNLALTSAINNLFAGKTIQRLVLWHHDLAWTSRRYQGELHSGYPWDLIRTHWDGATQVVISEARRMELADLMQISPKRIVMVPNGIDIPAFLKLGSKARELTEKLDLLRMSPLLLLPVRITLRKNIELALYTLAELKKIHQRAGLVVTGPLGPHNPANLDYFSQLKEIRAELGVENSVHFLAELSDGYLPDEVIADLYRLADGLFLPSREEGFGIPLIEAGLTGIPVFCSQIDSLQALGKNEAYYFSPDEDPRNVAKLIAESLENDRVFTLRARVWQEFSWQAIYAQKISPLLESLR
jgi:mannosylglucosylglycerate synthase